MNEDLVEIRDVLKQIVRVLPTLATKDDFAELKAAITGVQRDVAGVQRDVAGVQKGQARLEAEVAVLKSDVGELKTDVSGLKTDVSSLKTDVSSLKTDVSSLKTDMSVLKAGQARILEHLDVAELKGRVEEISRRLPTTIAYSPPVPEKKRP